MSVYVNLFIAYKSGRSLKKNFKRKPINLIQLVMAINNLTMRCTQVVEEAGFWLPVGVKFFKVMDIYLDLYTFIAYWLTAFLCAFYFLNISKFSPQILTLIKRNLSILLPYILFFTGAGSMVITFLYLWKVEASFSGDSMNRTRNATSHAQSIVDNTLFYAIFLFIFGCCVPFVGVMFFLLVTVTSLLKHVWNIGYTGWNVQVYTTAIRTMLMFLILLILFYISDIVNFATGDTSQSFTFIITWLLMVMFPSAEALIIIQASPKLRKTFPRWFCIRANGDNSEGI
uniref:Taste receptor type 2 n=1 Tax=Pyxicephalus adspersus TaxID=30357 RepID=A0AAV2ZXY0_PYXAD|nr:TPA: hypothetical protein GDO54_014776 [Pyxicephalus adspersus]